MIRVYIHGVFGRDITIYTVWCTFTCVRMCTCRVGQNRKITVYIHGVFGREITKYTVFICLYTVLANPMCVHTCVYVSVWVCVWACARLCIQMFCVRVCMRVCVSKGGGENEGERRDIAYAFHTIC
jgi:FlaA1/EpsC-like NDP-sugar epimerase